MDRTFQALAASLGFVAVALGAFGAHALKSRLSDDLLAVFQTGVQYHFYHVLALAALAAWVRHTPSPAATAAGWCFVAGIALFSGSLYALALSGVRVLGVVTPVGGLAFLAGWASWAWAAWRSGTAS